MKFILFCVTLDLSDNLTEMRLKGLTWKTEICKDNPFDGTLNLFKLQAADTGCS